MTDSTYPFKHNGPVR